MVQPGTQKSKGQAMGNVIADGFLEVGDGHKIYWLDWGSPDAKTPIFSLHGGPGDGFKPEHNLKFDPTKQRVIFHDQRGSGSSTPSGSTDNNTSADLVADIEKLRKHLKIENMIVSGGSWGSTLSLLYAQVYPEVVERIIIWSIFLARKSDIDFFNDRKLQGYFFPDIVAGFKNFAPKDRQDDVEAYYQEVMAAGGPESEKAALEWSYSEGARLRLKNDPIKLRKDLEADEEKTYIPLGKLEAHYLNQGCFLIDNQILDNISKIKHIPTTIIHGNYDFVCPPSSAIDLHRAMPNSTLQFVVAGHATGDLNDPLVATFNAI